MRLDFKKQVLLICILLIASANTNRTKRSTATCGVTKGFTGYIVGGQSVARGDFPWAVALLLTKPNTSPTFFCAGTLISSTFVVSAAHCILQKTKKVAFLPREVIALFGAHDLSDPYENGRISQSPETIILHEEWNPNTVKYDADISLLKFEEGSILFNENSAYIRPICLWNETSEPTATEGFVMGWGKSGDSSRKHENEPKLIKVPIHSNEDCFLEAERLVSLSSRRTFCAGSGNGTGVCTGDSGGGLYIKVRGVYYFKGFVSSSLVKNSMCDVTNYAVYTNVLKYKIWIEMKTTQNVVAPFQKVTSPPAQFSISETIDASLIWGSSIRKNTATDVKRILKWNSAISNVMERFALQLMVEVNEINLADTFMVSPYSIYQMLVLIAEGANGNSFAQLNDLLGLQSLPKTRDFLEYLAISLNKTSADIVLHKFTMIITDAARPVADDYEARIKKTYDAIVERVYFNQVDRTLEQINWRVSQLTGNQINDALSREDLYKARLILLSGLYFQGSWAQRFNNSFTKVEDFYDTNGRKTGQVNMMFQRGPFAYSAVAELGCEILQLPYAETKSFNKNVSTGTGLNMILALPNKGLEINEVVHKIYTYGMGIIYKKIYDANNDYSDRLIDVHLPRFEISTNFNLKEPLKGFGITDVFDQTHADLSKINDQYFVSAMIHKTKISMDEKGTTAAAVTTSYVTSKTRPPKFHANKPFIFFIVDPLTKLVLFSGQYVTPVLY